MWLHYLVKHNMCQTVHNHSNTIIKRHGKVTVTRTNTITTKCSMCFPLALTPTLRWSHHWLIAWSITLSCSVRFVKKNTGGRRQARGSRRRRHQHVTLTLGLESTPRSSNRQRLGGQKIIGRVEPPNPSGKSDPAVLDSRPCFNRLFRHLSWMFVYDASHFQFPWRSNW